eukprot:gene9259-biopygen11127
MSWWPFGKKPEAAALPPAEPEKPKKKICCACPDTKRLRDECIATHGVKASAGVHTQMYLLLLLLLPIVPSEQPAADMQL